MLAVDITSTVGFAVASALLVVAVVVVVVAALGGVSRVKVTVPVVQSIVGCSAFSQSRPKMTSTPSS